MSRQLRIRYFVQNILGCTCPGKVFEQIADKPVAPLSSPHTRSITIGGRLLVYIWYVEGADKFKENFFVMLEAGRKERDEKGLNRFRAVLAVDGMLQHLAIEATSYFSQYVGKDGRIHFHVVPSENLKNV